MPQPPGELPQGPRNIMGPAAVPPELMPQPLEGVRGDLHIVPYPPHVVAEWTARLDSLGIGHGTPERYNLVVGAGPVQITRPDYERLQRNGRVIRDWMETTADLYRRSIDGRGPFYGLADLLESGMSPEEKKLQRRLVTTRGVRLPSIVRADMTDMDRATEVQVFGGGWGLMHSITDVMLGDEANFGMGLPVGFAQAVRDLTGKENPRVLWMNSRKEIEADGLYFLRHVQDQGVEAHLVGTETPLPLLDGYDVVVPRHNYPLRDVGKFNGSERVWEAYASGGVQLEPPPEQIFSSKVVDALPFHPATRSLYSDEIRALFPETLIVDPKQSMGLPATRRNGDGTVTLDWGNVTPWDKVAELPSSQRRWTLKYAGAFGDGSSNTGGKRVFDLAGGKKGVKAHMDLALAETEQGLPWIVQLKIDSEYEVPRWERGLLYYDRMHMRFTPLYLMPRAGGAEIIGGSALFRGDWKVHGSSESVHHAIVVGE